MGGKLEADADLCEAGGSVGVVAKVPVRALGPLPRRAAPSSTQGCASMTFGDSCQGILLSRLRVRRSNAELPPSPGVLPEKMRLHDSNKYVRGERSPASQRITWWHKVACRPYLSPLNASTPQVASLRAAIG